MRRALALARRGRGGVSPNPMVGCVLVKNGRPVAEGWHARFGGPHAEPAALAKAGARARGATAYVTLEPCCRHAGKKTPPCTEALVSAGVRKVVAAMRDPNPRVSGKGLAELRRAGVAAECGLLEEEALRLNRGFVSLMRRGRPYVILKAGASLDGRVETSARESKWITSGDARLLGRRMRGEVDAILAGAGTVLSDDPRLTAADGLPDPVRVVLDSRLRIPRRARVLNGRGRCLVMASPSAPRRDLGPSAEVVRVRAGRRGLDLRAVLRELAKRGIASVLVEGGPRVHTAFLEAGLVDEVHLFLSPRLIGGEGARSFFEGRGFARLSGTPTLSDLSVRRVGPDILITGRISRGL